MKSFHLNQNKSFNLPKYICTYVICNFKGNSKLEYIYHFFSFFMVWNGQLTFRTLKLVLLCAKQPSALLYVVLILLLQAELQRAAKDIAIAAISWFRSPIRVIKQMELPFQFCYHFLCACLQRGQPAALLQSLEASSAITVSFVLWQWNSLISPISWGVKKQKLLMKPEKRPRGQQVI